MFLLQLMDLFSGFYAVQRGKSVRGHDMEPDTGPVREGEQGAVLAEQGLRPRAVGELEKLLIVRILAPGQH